MAVALCHRCGRFISISIIPEGNPVTLTDPEQWSRSYRSCPVCHEAYCDRCMELEPLCPNCSGPPKRPSKAHWIERIPWLCRNQHYTDFEMVNLLWEFTNEQPTIEARIKDIKMSFPAETMRLISEIAVRNLSSFSDDGDSVLWSSTLWNREDLQAVPKEFSASLAGCGRSDSAS